MSELSFKVSFYSWIRGQYNFCYPVVWLVYFSTFLSIQQIKNELQSLRTTTWAAQLETTHLIPVDPIIIQLD